MTATHVPTLPTTSPIPTPNLGTSAKNPTNQTLSSAPPALDPVATSHTAERPKGLMRFPLARCTAATSLFVGLTMRLVDLRLMVLSDVDPTAIRLVALMELSNVEGAAVGLVGLSHMDLAKVGLVDIMGLSNVDDTQPLMILLFPNLQSNFQ